MGARTPEQTWNRHLCIVVDLAGIVEDAWRAPKVGRCQVGWCMGAWEYPPSQLGGLGSVVRSSNGVRGRTGPKTDFGVFWRPQNAPFCNYMTKSEETICISVPYSKFCANCPPSTVWSTPMHLWYTVFLHWGHYIAYTHWTVKMLSHWRVSVSPPFPHAKRHWTLMVLQNPSLQYPRCNTITISLNVQTSDDKFPA